MKLTIGSHLIHERRLGIGALAAADTDGDEAVAGLGREGRHSDAVDVVDAVHEVVSRESAVGVCKPHLEAGVVVVGEEKVVATVAVEVGDAWAAPFKARAGLVDVNFASNIDEGGSFRGERKGWNREEEEMKEDKEEGRVRN